VQCDEHLLLSNRICESIRTWLTKLRLYVPLDIMRKSKHLSQKRTWPINVHHHTHTTILWLSGFVRHNPGEPIPEETFNIHPLTSIVVINHPLSASSIYYNPWHTLRSIYVPDSLFPQYLSKFSLVYLLAWNPPLNHNGMIIMKLAQLAFANHESGIGYMQDTTVTFDTSWMFMDLFWFFGLANQS